ncbi:MAG TPA: hypothetical protein VI168_14975 [Croceibacterium sp.]
MILQAALSLLLAQDLVVGPPASFPEFLNPATARHETILQCTGGGIVLVRWSVGAGFRIGEFVFNQFVASEEDLKPVNEAVASFGDQSAVVVRCNSSGAMLSVRNFQDPRKSEVRSYFFNGRGFRLMSSFSG